MKQMAHRHPDLPDYCTIDEPRWTMVDVLIAVGGGIVVAVAVALFLFLVLVWA